MTESNVVEMPLGINEAERLTKALTNAVAQFYVDLGKVDANGRPVVPPRTALAALGAVAGYMLESAPAGAKQKAFDDLIQNVRAHASMAEKI